MIEKIGWLGSTLLALCGAPEAYLAATTGESSLSWTFLCMWLSGELLALVYVIHKNSEVKVLPLIFNYGLNIIFISIICIFKYY